MPLDPRRAGGGTNNARASPRDRDRGREVVSGIIAAPISPTMVARAVQPEGY